MVAAVFRHGLTGAAARVHGPLVAPLLASVWETKWRLLGTVNGNDSGNAFFFHGLAAAHKAAAAYRAGQFSEAEELYTQAPNS